jgi:hypothetical protein
MAPEETKVADFPGFDKVGRGALAALRHAGIHTLDDLINVEKAIKLTDYSKLPYAGSGDVVEALRWRESVLLHYEVEKRRPIPIDFTNHEVFLCFLDSVGIVPTDVEELEAEGDRPARISVHIGCPPKEVPVIWCGPPDGGFTLTFEKDSGKLYAMGSWDYWHDS